MEEKFPDGKKETASSVPDRSSVSVETLVRLGDDATFAAGGGNRFYKPIAKYEGTHRYDPQLEWTEHEEKALIRRLDWRICAWVCLMFFCLQCSPSSMPHLCLYTSRDRKTG